MILERASSFFLIHDLRTDSSDKPASLTNLVASMNGTTTAKTEADVDGSLHKVRAQPTFSELAQGIVHAEGEAGVERGVGNERRHVQHAHASQ